MVEKDEKELTPTEPEPAAEESHQKPTTNWESYSLALLTILDN